MLSPHKPCTHAGTRAHEKLQETISLAVEQARYHSSDILTECCKEANTSFGRKDEELKSRHAAEIKNLVRKHQEESLAMERESLVEFRRQREDVFDVLRQQLNSVYAEGIIVHLKHVVPLLLSSSSYTADILGIQPNFEGGEAPGDEPRFSLTAHPDYSSTVAPLLRQTEDLGGEQLGGEQSWYAHDSNVQRDHMRRPMMPGKRSFDRDDGPAAAENAKRVRLEVNATPLTPESLSPQLPPSYPDLASPGPDDRFQQERTVHVRAPPRVADTISSQEPWNPRQIPLSEVRHRDWIFEYEGRWIVILCDYQGCRQHHHRYNPLEGKQLELNHQLEDWHGLGTFDKDRAIKEWGWEVDGASIEDVEENNKKIREVDCAQRCLRAPQCRELKSRKPGNKYRSGDRGEESDDDLPLSRHWV